MTEKKLTEMVDLLYRKCMEAIPGENQENERKLYLREALRAAAGMKRKRR